MSSYDRQGRHLGHVGAWSRRTPGRTKLLFTVGERFGKRERTEGMAGEGSRQGGLGNPAACAMQRCLVSVFSTEARPSLFKLTLLF
jgi:hypothetical protein